MATKTTPVKTTMTLTEFFAKFQLLTIAEIDELIAEMNKLAEIKRAEAIKQMRAQFEADAAAIGSTVAEILKITAPESLPINAMKPAKTWVSRNDVLAVLTKEHMSLNDICKAMSHDNKPMVGYYLKKLIEEKKVKRVGKLGSYKYHA
jgi:hypothetical protein